MSEVWGADPVELDALAVRLTTSAERLDEIRSSSRRELVAPPWEGRDGEQFRNRWEAEGMRRLAAAATMLRSAGEVVRANADDQRRTSAGDGGTFGGGTGSGGSGAGAPGGPGAPRGGPADGPRTGPSGAPVPGAGYPDRIADTRTAMEDELAARRARLAELRDRLDHADGGPEEWFKDIVPLWDSDAEAIRAEMNDEERSIGRLEDLLSDPDRQFLKVDVEGDGRIIEVHGDLAGADHVAVFVPGMDTSIDSYTSRPHDYATNVFAEMRRIAAPGTNVAVVSFLDYNPPDLDWSLPLGAGEGRATEGAVNLSAFVGGLRDSGYPADAMSVIAHSYGSTVTGIALEHEGLGVSTVAVVGSPGLGDGVDDIADLGRSDVRVFAGRAEGVPLPGGSGDPVSWLPVHGEDPADAGFGAERFDTGSVSGHSGYFDDESTSLRNLALIALGEEPSLR